MAHFYGTMKGSRGEVTRCGGKTSGLATVCASWKGAIRSSAYVDAEGVDCVLVEKICWQGQGEYKVLYNGPIGESKV